MGRLFNRLVPITGSFLATVGLEVWVVAAEWRNHRPTFATRRITHRWTRGSIACFSTGLVEFIISWWRSPESTPPFGTVPMLSKMKDYCLSAIAYLKVEVIDDQELHVDLSEGDSPALRNLGHGLLVSYLVDEGDYYSYVQERHLAESDVTLEQ